MKRYPFDRDGELLDLAAEIQREATWGALTTSWRSIAVAIVELCESVGLDAKTASIGAIRALVLGVWDLDATLPPFITIKSTKGK